MIGTVLFDLGNTLVSYYTPSEFPLILERSISAAASYLRSIGRLLEPPEVLLQRAAAENREAADCHVLPLEQRLARIFAIESSNVTLLEETGRKFMAGIFTLSRIYPDTLPALEELRRRGYRIGIVSNTPWGSSPNLWREELHRLGLVDLVDAAIFCGDVGWRKPAEPIFHRALQRLGATARETLFVGDDPHWDIAGPQRIGMQAALIDRLGRPGNFDGASIRSLDQVPALAASL